MVKVSVCVTTYNRAPLLDHTLRSLADQTRPPDELIVSDNCSSDNTPEVVDKWKTQFRRFLYNRNAQNLYMPGNLNAGLKLTTGKYVANLHDADMYDPTLLEKWERALDAYPSAGFVFCGLVDPSLRAKNGDVNILHDVPPLTPGREFYERYFLHKFSSLVWGTVMARQKAYDELLPFAEKYSFVSDVDMWMRMCLKYDVAYVREPLIIIDNSPTDWRQASWERAEIVREMELENIKIFYSNDPRLFKKTVKKHEFIARRRYMRLIVGRAWHGDWARVREGIKLLKNI